MYIVGTCQQSTTGNDNAMTEEKLITTKELADHLGVHPETIRRMCKRNQIPFIKISERDFKYKLTEVMARISNEG